MSWVLMSPPSINLLLIPSTITLLSSLLLRQSPVLLRHNLLYYDVTISSLSHLLLCHYPLYYNIIIPYYPLYYDVTYSFTISSSMTAPITRLCYVITPQSPLPLIPLSYDVTYPWVLMLRLKQPSRSHPRESAPHYGAL